MSDKETAPRCPKCSQPLQRVRYPSESMLNRDQWDSIRAGDWFCECHNNHAGNQPYAYFWEKDLRVAVECTAPAPLPAEMLENAYMLCAGERDMWKAQYEKLAASPQVTHELELEQDADGRWLAEFTRFHGVAAYGPSKEEAIRNAAKVLIESEALPYEKAWPIIRRALGLPEDHPDGSDILSRIEELKAASGQASPTKKGDS